MLKQRTKRCGWLAAAIWLAAGSGAAHATTPTEPTFPSLCGSELTASITSIGPTGPTTGRTVPSGSTPDTTRVQTALNNCSTGSSVELKNGTGDAFLIGPITVPAGVSLTVAAGTTVFASTNAQDYDLVPGTHTCGHYSATYGCKALITFLGSNSGLYGYGIIDGQGWVTPSNADTCGTSGTSWWDRTLNIGTSGNSCYGDSQNNPRLVYATADNFILYKITLRNSPFWNILWRPINGSNPGLTVWGLKATAPWNIPNTDGIDIDGPYVYVTDSVFGVGDDEIAIEAPDWSGAYTGPVSNVLVENTTGYGRNGYSIGSELNYNVSSVTIQDSNLTAGYPHVAASGSDWYINNTLLSTITASYPNINSIDRVMPADSTNIRGLNIKTNSNSDGGSPATVSGIEYSNICMENIVQPVTIEPYMGATPPVSTASATYNGIWIMTPDPNQMVGYSNTAYSVPQSAMTFEAPSSGGNTVTLENFYFSPLTSPSAYSALGYVYNEYSNITTTGNVYPTELQASYTASGKTVGLDVAPGIGASSNAENVHTYIPYTMSGTNSATVTPVPSTFNCYEAGNPTNEPFTFLSIDASLSESGGPYHTNTSTNSASPMMLSTGTFTVGAVIQPAISQVGFYGSPDYGTSLYAVPAPQPTAEIQFQLKNSSGVLLQTVSSAIATQAGTAYGTFTGIANGTYTLVVYYPGDVTGGSAQVVYPAAWRKFTIQIN